MNAYLKPTAVERYDAANILHILSSNMLSKLSITSSAEDCSEFIIERRLITALISSSESGNPIFLNDSASETLKSLTALQKFSQKIYLEL